MKEGWEYKKLGEVTTTINGLWTGKKPPFINVAVIRNTNFTKDCQLDMSNVAYLDVEEKQFSTRKLQYGDIIIEKSGGSEKQPVGRPVLFNIKEGDYSFSNFTSTLRIKEEKEMDSRFLHYSLIAAYNRGVTSKMQAKTTGIHNLDFKAYLKLLIPIPSINEQQQIISELDLLSDVIENQKAQIEELDKLAQSIFYNMFGDPVTNEKNWELKKLGDVSDITSSKRIFANEYREDGIPFYRGKEITEKSKGQEISLELFISEERYEEIKESFGVPSIGDILITAVGTIGNIWVVNDTNPFYFKDGNIIWVKDFKNIDPTYFKSVLTILIATYKGEMANGCAYNALTIVNLKKMSFALPPLALQQEFAAKIEAIEHMKAKVRQSLKESEELFNSRMDYYFN